MPTIISGDGTITGLTSTGISAAQAIDSASIANSSITPAKLSQPFTRATSVSATGTSIDFTSIPSWVKRITVMFQGVSGNGTSPFIMRLGTSSGFVSTGYLTAGVYTGVGTGSGNRTDSLLICGNAVDSFTTIHGNAVLTNITGNSWVQNFVMGQSNDAYALLGGGSITLGGVLDRVRITTVNGTDSYDAGSINILYE
jgi:hypothetical protein